MLAMGKTKSWPYALEKMTGSKEMSVAPMIKYFEPLQEWLVKERCSKRYKIGWPGQPADDVSECTAINAASSCQSCIFGLLFYSLVGLLQ